MPGFCKAATLNEIRGHNYVLTPGRYVGAAAADEDDVPFEGRFTELAEELGEQFAKAAVLEQRIRTVLARVQQ